MARRGRLPGPFAARANAGRSVATTFGGGQKGRRPVAGGMGNARSDTVEARATVALGGDRIADTKDKQRHDGR